MYMFELTLSWLEANIEISDLREFFHNLGFSYAELGWINNMLIFP